MKEWKSGNGIERKGRKMQKTKEGEEDRDNMERKCMKWASCGEILK